MVEPWDVSNTYIMTSTHITTSPCSFSCIPGGATKNLPLGENPGGYKTFIHILFHLYFALHLICLRMLLYIVGHHYDRTKIQSGASCMAGFSFPNPQYG